MGRSVFHAGVPCRLGQASMRSIDARPNVHTQRLSDLLYSVWWDSSLTPTGTYSEEITGKLNLAKAIIVIWSAEAAQSLWVKSEANHAARSDKLINCHVSGFDPETQISRPFEQIHSVLVSDVNSIVSALKAKKVPRGIRQQEPITEAALPSGDLLPFLRICTTDELEQLVQFTCKAWNADKLHEISLTKHPLYPEHSEYVDEIDRQFRLLGGHAIRNLVRDEGPTYRKILENLSERNKTGMQNADSVIDLERKFLLKKFLDIFSKLEPAQRTEIVTSINDELKKRVPLFGLMNR